MNQGAIALVEKAQPVPYKVGEVEFIALADRVVVEEDEFRSGYECNACAGKGKLVCVGCQGTGKSAVNPEIQCKDCHGSLTVTCSECGGKGGLLVIPEQSERRPSSGRVVSAGEDCKTLKVGDNVLYSNFAGHAIDLDRVGLSIVLRILHEKEVLCRVSGHLELRTLRNKTEIAGTI